MTTLSLRLMLWTTTGCFACQGTFLTVNQRNCSGCEQLLRLLSLTMDHLIRRLYRQLQGSSRTIRYPLTVLGLSVLVLACQVVGIAVGCTSLVFLRISLRMANWTQYFLMRTSTLRTR
jgi:hypothetical protein